MSIVNVVCSNIIVKENKFLLVKESKEVAIGMYSLPGGKMEFGETHLEAAIREAREETGLMIKPFKLIGIYQRARSKESTNTTFFCFASEIIGGKIQTSKEHPEITYFSLDEIKQMNARGQLRSKYMYPAIQDYTANKGIDTSFLSPIE